MTRRKAIKAYRKWEADTRARSWHDARALAVAIVECTADGLVPYDIGVVLEPGEQVWYRCPAIYQWRTSVSWTEQRISYWGYRASAHEMSTPRMVCIGMTDWLVTDRRLATRQFDGQVISIYWTALTGMTIDLAAERLVLDGNENYHGELIGPAMAPIAVAAVAACHGTQALLDHPALKPLRARPHMSTGTPRLEAINR
jgi:hypothetical protein